MQNGWLEKSLGSYKRGSLSAQKWRFPSRISSVNITKTARNYGFGHI